MPMTFFRSNTLFSRILFSCLIPLVIMIIFLLWFTSSLLFRNAKEVAEDESVFYSTQISEIIQSVFVDNSSALILVGEQIKLLDKKSPDFRAKLRSILQAHLKIQPNIFDIYVVLNKGVVTDDWFAIDLIVEDDGRITEYFDEEGYRRLNEKDKMPWYNVPMQTGEFYLNNLDMYDYGDKGSQYISTVSYPIKVDGTVIGVVGIDAFYKNYYGFLDNIQIENKQGILLIGQQGEILYSHRKEIQGAKLFDLTRFKEEDAMRRALSENTFCTTEDESFLFEGKSFISIYPINHDGGSHLFYMFVDMPVKALYGHANEISTMLLLIGGIICTLLTISIYWTVSNSIKTIRGLTNVANKIIAGDYEADYGHYISTNRSSDRNEIVVLENSIIKMLNQIKAHMDEREKFNSALKAAKEKAEASNRLKSAFLANMSHEIRTPLNAIVGFSSILETTNDPGEKEEYVAIIQKNNELLLQLIGDILDLSKIEAGTLEFVYSGFNLNELMHTQESTMLIKHPNPDVKLSFVSGVHDCWIHSERNRLTQVLTNLIGNAIKFTEKGSIRFGYRIDNEKPGFLYFFVTDTGTGIEPEKLSSVFERFVKLNSFMQGTGLGLSICQVIIEQLGGEIGVESAKDKGSTFWFRIPYVPYEQ